MVRSARWERRGAIALAAITIAAAACGGDALPDPSITPPAPPPGDNDPAFDVQRVRDWYLIGNALTPGQDTLELQVFAPDGVNFIDAWVDGGPGVRLVDADTDFRQLVDIAALGTGEHELLLAANGSDVAFARLVFRRTHPLYVVVLTDWDNADNRDANLMRQEELHARHPELRLTHFVGPYTFTDPAVTGERRAFLVDWLTGMRDDHGDEIGVHIHPYCNFVNTTPVTCRTEPSSVYPAGDASGYTVIVASYTEQEFTTLLQAAAALFEQNGLGTPASFRAGGWTADLGTLRALVAAGYAVDSSASNWARMEEWDGSPPGATLYEWNQQNWASIGDTSQPYYPSETALLDSGPPVLPLLEVPDNGLLVDYVTAEEMIEIFDANWPGLPLAAPAVYQIGFHPPNFSEQFKNRIDTALLHADQFLASAGRGPVVYATLSELTHVFPQPE